LAAVLVFLKGLSRANKCAGQISTKFSIQSVWRAVLISSKVYPELTSAPAKSRNFYFKSFLRKTNSSR